MNLANVNPALLAGFVIGGPALVGAAVGAAIKPDAKATDKAKENRTVAIEQTVVFGVVSAAALWGAAKVRDGRAKAALLGVGLGSAVATGASVLGLVVQSTDEENTGVDLAMPR